MSRVDSRPCRTSLIRQPPSARRIDVAVIEVDAQGLARVSAAAGFHHRASARTFAGLSAPPQCPATRPNMSRSSRPRDDLLIGELSTASVCRPRRCGPAGYPVGDQAVFGVAVVRAALRGAAGAARRAHSRNRLRPRAGQPGRPPPRRRCHGQRQPPAGRPVHGRDIRLNALAPTGTATGPGARHRRATRRNDDGLHALRGGDLVMQRPRTHTTTAQLAAFIGRHAAPDALVWIVEAARVHSARFGT